MIDALDGVRLQADLARVDGARGAAVVTHPHPLYGGDRFNPVVETMFRTLPDAGFTTTYLPEVTVVHVGNAASATIPDRRLNELWRSRHRYWRAHHSRVGAHVAAIASGLQHALRALAMGALRRPAAAGQRLQARNAWRGVSGPGLAELAEAQERVSRP